MRTIVNINTNLVPCCPNFKWREHERFNFISMQLKLVVQLVMIYLSFFFRSWCRYFYYIPNYTSVSLTLLVLITTKYDCTPLHTRVVRLLSLPPFVEQALFSFGHQLYFYFATESVPTKLLKFKKKIMLLHLFACSWTPARNSEIDTSPSLSLKKKNEKKEEDGSQREMKRVSKRRNEIIKKQDSIINSLVKHVN